MWNHAEEVPCVQRDPSASQPSNVSQPLNDKEREDTGWSAVWDVCGKHGPNMVPSPIYRILADSSVSDAVSISHQFTKQQCMLLLMGQNNNVCDLLDVS